MVMLPSGWVSLTGVGGSGAGASIWEA